MLAVIAIFAASTLTALIWLGVTAIASPGLGATVLEARLFTGPAIHLGQFQTTRLSLGLIPWGSSVRLLDQMAMEQTWSQEFVTQPEQSASNSNPTDWSEWQTRFLQGRQLFEQLPWVSRMAIILSGWLVILLLAFMVLGVPQTHQAFWATYEETYRYLLEPDFARASLRWLNQAVAAQQWLSAITLLAVKITALNLIPVPFLAGGAAIQETAAAIIDRPVQFPNQWVATTFFLAIGLFCLFFVRTWNALQIV
ncbi:site-2 protease family protein [Pantanalinema sp. GBBB05]|uniref:site-2 protease family protein n=1 Tax=Pantanalinema sp. GBBB05 TaxID=2604139 RepID=UPI001D70EAF4|nr:hypothetical protein [Pantanalinema sp. GBBB05]